MSAAAAALVTRCIEYTHDVSRGGAKILNDYSYTSSWRHNCREEGEQKGIKIITVSFKNLLTSDLGNPIHSTPNYIDGSY